MEIQEEEVKYIERQIENHIGSTDVILENLRKKYPDSTLKLKDVVGIKGDYLRRRIGQNRYSGRKLTAFQIFDEGGSANDAWLAIGGMVAKHTAAEYYERWKKLNPGFDKRRRPSGKRAGGPPGASSPTGGVTFGPDTRHDTIWKS